VSVLEQFPPPVHLSEESKRQWVQMLEEGMHMDAAAYPMLVMFFEARDTRDQARLELAATGGPVVKDRFNQLKLNAWSVVARDAAIVMDRAFKSLGLTQAPPDPQGKLFD
jgi:phage terminase small subunit